MAQNRSTSEDIPFLQWKLIERIKDDGEITFSSQITMKTVNGRNGLCISYNKSYSKVTFCTPMLSVRLDKLNKVSA